MAMMTDSTSRLEFELATNTELSDFQNVEAKREEQRNCLKHVVGRIDVFAISPTGFAIMKDQVEHLNKIGVAAAMMGEDVDEAVKSGSCEIV